MDSKNYYKTMGLQSDASAKEIKMAYRRLARKYHPDISKETNAEEKFKNLGEAYEVLKDPEKRRMYDQSGSDWQSSGQNQQTQSSQQNYQRSWESNSGHSQFDDDLFETLFGGRPFTGRHHINTDIHATISISLEESCNGAVKTIQMPNESDTENKYQTLRVKIPAGIKSGQQIRLAGQGRKNPSQDKAGDLFLTVEIQKHRIFDVIDNDVYLTLPVTPWEVALGCTINTPTINGSVSLKIPPGSQGGNKLRLKGKGIPGKLAGDQFVILKIETPRAENDGDKALYKKMALEMPLNPREKMGV